MLDFRHLVGAACNSFAGLREAFRHQTSFRQLLVLGALLTPVALWLGESGLERAVLLGSMTLVLIVELLNSALETVVDRIGPEPNELSGRVKDMGSAAALLSQLNVPLVWGFVLLG